MNQEERTKRSAAYTDAKVLLKKQNASLEEMKSCIDSLPENGHKALALRLRLHNKMNGLPYGWDDI